MPINFDYQSPNYSDRSGKAIDIVDSIIIHYTLLNFKKSVGILTNKHYNVSAHYVIREDGAIFNLVSPEKRAHHAGVSFWRGKPSINDNSIGIEIVNDGNSEFPNVQVQSLINLCNYIRGLYPKISDRNIIGHSDIAIGRKMDPGQYFPWEYFANNGHGIWPQNIGFSEDDRKIIFKLHDSDEKILDIKEKLSQYGYKISNIDKNFDYELKLVLQVMQLHFDPKNASGNLDIHSIKIIDFLGNLKDV